MKYRQFGNTGKKVSEYGLGTWAMGGNAYGKVDDEESIRTIHRAQDLGINFLDTAPSYSYKEDGHSEMICGKALKGRRDQWMLSSKYGRSVSQDKNGQTVYGEDFSTERAITSVEQSLKRLQTDHLDVYFVHTPSFDIPGIFNPEEAFAAMTKLKEQGKIKYIGFSFHLHSATWLEQIEPFLRSNVIDVVQVGISLLLPEPLDVLLPIIKETGTAFVARESLANGYLTDSFTEEGPFPKGHPFEKADKEKIREKLAKANKFKFLIDRAEGVASLPEAALHWTVSLPEVSLVIPGAKTIGELEQCVNAADAEAFDESTMQEVRGIQKAWGDWNIYG